MGTYAVTGAASGIGAATTAVLRERGHRVVSVDREDAEVVADLATPDGRARAVREILAACSGRLNGVVPCAGLAGVTGADSARLVSVNYFGAVEVVAGLRPALAAAAAAGEPSAVVVLSSNSVTCQPGWDLGVARRCLAGDEPDARELAGAREAVLVYPATKAALAWWVRREGVTPDWIGAGVRLNAVAPGLVATPMTDGVRADPVLGRFADRYPTAIGRPGRPEEVARTIAFLLSEEAGLLVGSVLVVDGGTDALTWPTRPRGRVLPAPLGGVTSSLVRTLPRLARLAGRSRGGGRGRG
ncbi:SDR family oxidoreductase [Nocardioides sp. HDW12B]|uniref:SDR family oxidoreductase n=1 Tax=Nocardioides sp. HDW12B TaxID=2714939 RepID=UPI00140A0000|nr:SDR family oxidoreductase [Nocardioides sp. HDW12B]QIK67763.1 SDR family oxidoreductase [Nocardioides sp. HDW12B]